MKIKEFLQSQTGAWLTLIFIFVIFYFAQKSCSENFHNHIANNPAIADGYVFDAGYHAKSGWSVSYSFVANNEVIKRSKSNKDYERIRNIVINRSFPMLYNRNDPDDNVILITPEDFQSFNISFPDSLI